MSRAVDIAIPVVVAVVMSLIAGLVWYRRRRQNRGEPIPEHEEGHRHFLANITLPKTAWPKLGTWIPATPLGSLPLMLSGQAAADGFSLDSIQPAHVPHFEIGLVMHKPSQTWLHERGIVPSERYTVNDTSCQYTVRLCPIDEQGLSVPIAQEQSNSAMEFYAINADEDPIRLDALAVAKDTPTAIIRKLHEMARPKLMFSPDDLKLPDGLNKKSWSQHLLNPIPGLVEEISNRQCTV
ncbi:hypothetical protein B0T10DRAFT_494799 [Thelonectria olida]|uniref:Uncharacterized protein n=1 Tax=Thelonectria olida TaxID=1576542 RepID=A0A9P8VXJ5_9HYPO|nr:hypothetical protein B0T10DRAFT_494799 [Thelonectria olida]